MKVVLVAAIGENGVIGRAGGLPWRLKSDLQHFRRLTLHKPVVMGRKTWQSLPKALPHRTNIVITRDADFVAHAARKDAEARGTDEIMVIGGSDIFNAAMPLADRLEITRVHARPEGDVHFPDIDPEVWREISFERHARGPEDDCAFTVATLERVH